MDDIEIDLAARRRRPLTATSGLRRRQRQPVAGRARCAGHRLGGQRGSVVIARDGSLPLLTFHRVEASCTCSGRTMAKRLTHRGRVADVDTRPTDANGIVLLCGRSFSGKSTLASRLEQSLGGVLVSLDDINAERGFQGGAVVANDEWVRTHEISRSRTRSAVSAGAITIVDDTSSPRFLRDGWRKVAQELRVALVLVYVDTSVQESLLRHAANRVDERLMDVTDEILHEHLESFEIPTPDEDPVRYSARDADFDSVLRVIGSRLSGSTTSH